MNRRIYPSATRYGQRVDNPPLELHDTARLRILLQDETQDWRHKIDQALNEVEIVQTRHTERWETYLRKEAAGGFADQRDVRNLWIAFTSVCGVAITLIILLLTLLIKEPSRAHTAAVTTQQQGAP